MNPINMPPTRRKRRGEPKKRFGLRSLRPRRRGQALVEFALIVPVMFFLLLIAVDFGRLFFTYIEMNNASREGAAYAAGDPTDSSTLIAAYAARETNVQGQPGEGTLAVTWTCANSAGTTIACSAAAGGTGAGNLITVKVARPFTFLTPFISGFFGGSLNVSASSSAAVLGMAANGGATGPSGCAAPTLASFSATVSLLKVTVDASASQPQSGACAIASYDWDMGDGLDPFPPVVGSPATYTYGIAGTYIITLEISNPGGTLTVAKSVTVGAVATPTPTPSPTPTPTPTPSPTPTPTSSCTTIPSFTYAFTGNGNGSKAHEMTFYGAYTGAPAPASWIWNFGDSSSGSGQNDSDAYNNAGTYTVTLTVANGSCHPSPVSRTVVVP